MGRWILVVESAFLRRPDFQSRGPKTLIFAGLSQRFGAKVWGAPNADPTTADPTPHSRPSDGCLQVFRGSALLHSFFAFFSSLLRSFACFGNR